MKRGRKPKPSAIREAEGNRGHRRLNKREPRPTGGTTCPTWLTTDAKKEWRRLGPMLTKMGILTVLDRASFGAYCQTLVEVRELTLAVRKTGYTIETPGGIRKNPLWACLCDASSRMLKLSTEFGLTPSSRASLCVTPPKATDEPDLDAFSRAKPKPALKLTAPVGPAKSKRKRGPYAK